MVLRVVCLVVDQVVSRVDCWPLCLSLASILARFLPVSPCVPRRWGSR